MANGIIHKDDPRTKFLSDTRVPKPVLVANAVMAVVYFLVLALLFPSDYPILFWLLIAGEVFHVWQVLLYVYTVWDTAYQHEGDPSFKAPVDVFITVAGEPVSVVKETLLATLKMEYPSFSVYILNDGFVAQKDNWRDIEALAKVFGVSCITRKIPGGAKAGNINNGVKETASPFIAVFDADHVPHPDFLSKTMRHFSDPRVGFVQSPQFYRNHSENIVTESAWDQQQLFFGPICKGENRIHAVPMTGTNMVIRRTALHKAGGMCQESIAEDFATGMFIHEQGYISVYVPEVLAEGLAPEDFLSYYKQQYRWARGALDVFFRYKLLFRSRLSFRYKIQYLWSISYFLSGGIVLMNAVMPLVFFYTGAVPLQVSTAMLASVFIPYIFLTIYTLQRSSNFTFTFNALAFSMSAFPIHLSAIWAAAIRKRSSFSITSKKRLHGNFVYLAFPHICYLLLVLSGAGIAVVREGFSASFVNNLAWAAFNVAVFTPFVFASVSGILPATKVLRERAGSLSAVAKVDV